MTTYNKHPARLGIPPVVLLALVACTAGPAIPATLTPSLTPQPNITFFPTSTPKPVETHQIMRVFTPVATNTAWIFSSGLSFEKHPLAKRPEIEPLVIYPREVRSLEKVKHGSLVDRRRASFYGDAPGNGNRSIRGNKSLDGTF